MSSVLIDTHVWAWSMHDSRRLGSAGRAAIGAADIRLISAISFYEIGQKARAARWPEMTPLVPRLRELAVEQGLQIIGIDAATALAASLLEWRNRDPFDRIIAATALAKGATLISADANFDGLPGLRRTW